MPHLWEVQKFIYSSLKSTRHLSWPYCSGCTGATDAPDPSKISIAADFWLLFFIDQIELVSPPFDGVSQIWFSSTNPDHLVVAAWNAVRKLLTLVGLYLTTIHKQYSSMKLVLANERQNLIIELRRSQRTFQMGAMYIVAGWMLQFESALLASIWYCWRATKKAD